jgi:hypothetical protein
LIRVQFEGAAKSKWFPAFAGMTVKGERSLIARLEEFEGESMSARVVSRQRPQVARRIGRSAEPQSESLENTIPACADGVARNESPKG